MWAILEKVSIADVVYEVTESGTLEQRIDKELDFSLSLYSARGSIAFYWHSSFTE